MTSIEAGISDDMLLGTEAIAKWLLGDGAEARKIYGMAEAGRLPCFKIGKRICARKSVLLRWIEQQERGPVALRRFKRGTSVL